MNACSRHRAGRSSVIASSRERRLARRAAQGDRDALRELYEEYSEDLFAVAYRLTESAADARDVLHDVFSRLPRALRSYNRKGALGPWLRSVTTPRRPCATPRGTEASRGLRPGREPLWRAADTLRHRFDRVRACACLPPGEASNGDHSKGTAGLFSQGDRRPPRHTPFYLEGTSAHGAGGASRRAARRVGDMA